MKKLEQIKLFNSTREKDKLLIKYSIMTESPFRFFRGTCHLFYNDLLKQYPFKPSPDAWICGDLHTENFGSFKGANRLVYFDMVDFDETLLGPVLWDVVRLATSIVLVADELKFTLIQKKKLIYILLEQYQLQIVRQKAIAIELQTAHGIIKNLFEKVTLRKEKNILKKRTLNNSLIINDKLFALSKKIKNNLIEDFNEWFKKNINNDFIIKDIGFRIAGTGSIGVERYLCLAKHKTKKEKALLIDVKEALPSSLKQYCKVKSYKWANEAARVIETQALVQHVAPAFLSTYKYNNKWFIVKELQPTEDKVCVEDMMKKPNELFDYVHWLGIITASAHLRGSGRRGAASADELKLFIETKTWINEVVDWAIDYSNQVNIDYLDFSKACKQGYFN